MKSATTAAASVSSGLMIISGVSQLQMGPGLWMLMNTMQIARTTPIFTKRQNPLLANFLTNDMSTLGLKFDFIENPISKVIEYF